MVKYPIFAAIAALLYFFQGTIMIVIVTVFQLIHFFNDRVVKLAS